MSIYAWHFVDGDGEAHGGYKPPTPGTMERVSGEIVCCGNGLHGSVLPLDALGYCQNAHYVRRTVHSGSIDRTNDKLASSQRTALWQADCTRVLHEFGCWCAEGALALIEKPDPRSVAAIEVKRRWVQGEASDKELAAAWAAAGAAAWAAAWAAARDAAWAAARAAAWDAARAAQNNQLHKMLLSLRVR